MVTKLPCTYIEKKQVFWFGVWIKPILTDSRNYLTSIRNVKFVFASKALVMGIYRIFHSKKFVPAIDRKRQ